MKMYENVAFTKLKPELHFPYFPEHRSPAHLLESFVSKGAASQKNKDG